MKRKRNQCDESNNNVEKKFRFDEQEEEKEEQHQQQIRNSCAGGFEDDDNALDTSLLKKEFVLTREIADNAILCDITGNQWRIGAPVGKGSFGEIYLASNDTARPVDVHNANYVTKIEPHSNGPLFVEIHCLLNVNKNHDGKLSYFLIILLNFKKIYEILIIF
jgi:hypothetical protein